MTDKSSNTSKQIRRTRVRKLVRRLLIWVAMPTLFSIVYFGFLASAQYESTALLAVQSSHSSSKNIAKRESMQVREFALSRAMLSHLVDNYEFRKHFETDRADFHSRLSESADSESLYEFFREQVHVTYLARSSSLEVRVRAFSPVAAQEFSQAIVDSASKMGQRLTKRPADDLVKLAQEHAAEAKQALESAVRNTVQVTAATTATIPTEDASSAQLQSLEKAETAKVIQTMAQERYRAALEALDRARDGRHTRALYVTVLSPPSLPTGSAYPRRLWNIASVLVLSLVFMNVITMLGSAIKEHARF